MHLEQAAEGAGCRINKFAGLAKLGLAEQTFFQQPALEREALFGMCNIGDAFLRGSPSFHSYRLTRPSRSRQ